jgi:putative addiction module killer protein
MILTRSCPRCVSTRTARVEAPSPHVRRPGRDRRSQSHASETGLKPDVKSVGKGVHEARIDFGPGYRVYVAFDGTELILVLGGGEKHGQDDDIATAHRRWSDYKQRKRAAAR